MKNIFFTILSFFFAISVNAQLINDGASIIVEDGATLFIEGSLQNNLTGSIDIQGTGIVEVEGDVTNAATATITMSNTAKVILSGSNAANVTSGGATFTNVEMDKTSNNVSLLDQMRISTDLNFVGNNNKILIGDNNLVFAPSATITSADDNEYIVADGDANTGVVSKELSADEVFKFEIGDATNYTPLDADISGSGYSSATVDVNVVPMQQPNVPGEASDYISRYWNVDQTGVTDFSADLVGTYVGGDLTGVAGDVKGAHYGSVSTDWTYDAAAAGASTASGTIAESGDFTGTNAFGRVALMAMLDGAFSGGTMSTTLNSSGLLPTTSPYGDGASVAGGFFAANTDIVDWIYLESRNTATPASIEGTGSAFIKSDGTIVALDGTSNPFIKNAAGTGYVVVKHRNHLATCTGASIDLDGSAALQDFTSTGYTAYGTNGRRNNGGTMTMWAGDANADGDIIYVGATDITPISTAVFLDPGNTTFSPTYIVSGYNDADLNLDGNVIYVGATDITPISTSVFLHPGNTLFSPTYIINTQIPE